MPYQNHDPTPPSPTWTLVLFRCHPDYREEIEGDLLDRYLSDLRSLGTAMAHRRFYFELRNPARVKGLIRVSRTGITFGLTERFPLGEGLKMNDQGARDAKSKGVSVRALVVVASGAAILLAFLAITVIAAMFYSLGSPSPPNALQQLEEVTALETHVIPVLKDLEATWFNNDWSISSIHWKRGNFTSDVSGVGEDGASLFD